MVVYGKGTQVSTVTFPHTHTQNSIKYESFEMRDFPMSQLLRQTRHGLLFLRHKEYCDLYVIINRGKEAEAQRDCAL